MTPSTPTPTLALALAAALTLAAPGSAPEAEACTTFLAEAEGRVVVGKSYDWSNERGHVVVNPRGLTKTALVVEPRATPATWTARYASLTFNQYGRELPNGGMNERGLVVEVMWLTSSEAEPPDDRPVVNELQWIQRQLDLHATVAEVVADARAVRVAPLHARVHYLACDRAGACVAVEHIGGELVVTSAAGARALTNHTYARSIAALVARTGRPAHAGPGSLARFVRAAHASASAPSADRLVPHAWRTLADVSQGDYSKWRIVYEPAALRAHFQTLGRPEIKTVDLARLARSCDEPALALDLAADLPAGDVSDRLAPATAAANATLVAASLAELGASIPEPLVRAAEDLPETARCAR